MKKKFEGSSLNKIYELRQKYCIIGLTGRTASGVSEVANVLAYQNFINLGLPDLPSSQLNNNNDRKYKICYEYLSSHWQPFQVIKYKDVISLLVLANSFDDLIMFLKEWIFESTDFTHIKGLLIPRHEFKNNDKEIEEIEKLKTDFDSLHINVLKFWSNLSNKDKQKELWQLFSSQEFNEFSQKFHNALKSICEDKRIKILQAIANSYRSCGVPYCNSKTNDYENVFKIVEIINYIIKGFKSSKTGNSTKVVIDSLRNPLEVMYLKERYSAFYMFSINKDEKERLKKIEAIYKEEIWEQIKKIDDEEYESERGEFYRQNVKECIQRSDVHINYNITESLVNYHENIFYHINAQILKFVSLIYNPGLVTPSPEERCMQMAFTAKYNSGCISRQVGAAVADANYSIKSIGWNDTAENQVPCLLRNAQNLLDENDTISFTEYEKGENFKKTIKKFFTKIDNTHLEGQNCSFCFKDFQNYIEKEKNQVHTRSLHAEENAFLQIVKYGGQSVKNGILFTTASPCELCSKKAYQLGITKIYFIDPYPGIAKEQILKGGSNNPELKLFSGAIGRAYHKLYEPFIPYKDELLIRTGMRITNYKKNLEDKNVELKKQINDLKQQLEVAKQNK